MKLIRRMCHVALRTPDLERSVWHATEVIGLREVERVDDCVYLTCGPKHHDFQLIEADRGELDHFAVEATGLEALAEVERRLAAAEVELVPAPDEPGLGRAVRFMAPGGHVVEVHSGMAEDQPPHYANRGVRPRKFGHVTINTPQRAEFEGLFERVLGFVRSDRVGDDVVWMRCDTDHHGIAIARASAALRHLAWEVESWAHLEFVADHLVRNGIRLTWGPGRHGPGNNLAIYHRDPAGATHEYLADLQQIHDDSWRGKDWEGVWNWRNLWGFDTAPAPLEGDFPPVAEPVR